MPEAFHEDDLELLQTFIREHSFGAMVTVQDGLPVANHYPFLLDAQRGPQGTLFAHMARANSQWRSLCETQEVLVIFQGPHNYVSPSWYLHDAPGNVPTWNYAVVHAYGQPRLIEDMQELYDLLHSSVETFEAPFEQPWKLHEAEEYAQKMKSIVGFAIQITRLEGKFKLSQNRPKVDRERVIAALTKQDSPVADLMIARREKF
ncbi:MAG TPA: FMN-binding negative transcriptional regulator [Ktedonobacteraceae bacterium]|nr:FMN-binding negative transcriptional regulator [Ktedonobacteraceae bacterium]